MNERERFIASLTFGTPDKFTFSPGWPRESTLEAWRRQGLPESVDWHAHMLDLLGIDAEPRRERVPLGVEFKILPTFEEKVLEHQEGHYIVQDWMGAITEISDEFDYTYIRAAKDFVTRKWHRFPVESRADWDERIKWRYTYDHPERFPADFDDRCARLKMRDYPLQVSIPGPFWQMREWVGMENLCILMADDPDFADELAAFWQEFVAGMLTRILDKITPDYVQINEDMAYKAHSMISPAMTRRFLMPCWSSWGEIVKAAGVPVYCVDSDGNVDVLMPLFIEAGFNCNFPMEVAAGNDIVAARRKYGKQMAFVGGIDKRAMAAGGETMRAEVLRVVPPLLEDGGLIPGCDHGVPPDISWPNFVEYARLLAQLLGWL
jgi:uroporphyrinogen decarboxylase